MFGKKKTFDQREARFKSIMSNRAYSEGDDLDLTINVTSNDHSLLISISPHVDDAGSLVSPSSRAIPQPDISDQAIQDYQMRMEKVNPAPIAKPPVKKRHRRTRAEIEAERKAQGEGDKNN